MNICIYGASSNQPGEVYFQDAETLGRLIAEAGHTLVFGGGRDGLMGACARGALHAGGRVVGIAPEMFLDPGFLLDSCSEMILTASMAERKEKMLALSDAFICLAGGIGTMDEFFEAYVLSQLRVFDKPVALFNVNGYYDGIVQFIDHIAKEGFMRREHADNLIVSDDPKDLLEKMAKFEPADVTKWVVEIKEQVKG